MNADFDKISSEARREWDRLQTGAKPLVFVGTATCGASAGSVEVLEAFREELPRKGIEANLMEVGCVGLCYAEPIVAIRMAGKPGVCYGSVTPAKAREFVERTLLGGDPLASYALGTYGDGRMDGIPDLFETPIMRSQVRRVLRRCGFIDPTKITHYLANGGYGGLVRALDMRPEEIIEEVRASGLRGRGGAGFPTWRKWQFCRDAPGDVKYVICNADEGDPGAFMDRSLLESDPHALLEGMAIAGYALGAREGYIYCRAEYPLALERLGIALEQARESGFLGDNILGSGVDFHLKVKEGAGAFVCGEETALIASIEGKRGMPRPRPPFPAVSGLWGRPTIINNVESLACVSHILQNGAEWFAEYGTEHSKGTKTFALVGKVKNTGLVEVPLGITLREMIFDIGGGIAGGRRFKAVQTGGPSGGCIPADLLDTPVDYDSLTKAGTIMGSGGMVVMDEDTCMVDVARYFLEFTEKESCGECVPCRLGTKRMLELLQDITTGHGREGDVELLLEMGEGVKNGSLCGLGQTAPNPVLTTVRYFRDEYDAHVMKKRCPAVVCKETISSPCQHACPIGMEAQVYIALIAQGRFQEAFENILKDNPLPSVCGRVCHHPCETRCAAGRWGDPIAVRSLKRFATDWAVESGLHPRKDEVKPNGEKVAVIGAGPGGLMAGYRLACMSYDVTIYEALEVAGGALVACIPEYRLPRETLDRDIENIRRSGVKILTNTKVGRDISLEEIRSSHRAVFIATGAHKSRRLNIPGEDAEGVLDAMELLLCANLGRKVQIGKVVDVIGGGNSAVDAARVALRLPGVEKVRILYRRTRTEMPAFEEEVEAALEEGIEIQYLTAPVRVKTANGKVSAVECIRMELAEPDASGRPRPVPIDGSEFTVDLDTLVPAISEDPDISFLGPEQDLKVTKWNTLVVAGDTFATNLEGVFAGGDVVTGPDTVISAMAAGKAAAEMIDRHIRGLDLVREHRVTRPSMYPPTAVLTEEETESAARPVPAALTAADRRKNFCEVNLTMPEDVAVRGARRCLRCDMETEDARRATGRCEAGGQQG